MRKILSIALANAMLLSLFSPMAVMATEETTDLTDLSTYYNEVDVDVDALLEIAPEMQMQEDFTYEEVIENGENTDERWRSSIDMNWSFRWEDDFDTTEEKEAYALEDWSDPSTDVSDWRLLNVPHDWTIEAEYSSDEYAGTGYLPTGIAWYRKTLEVPVEWAEDGRQVSIEFDGIFRDSDIYVDGELVGGRAYGWISFDCDITDQVNAAHAEGREYVEIAVRVDNELQPAARWYSGSGIYGHVWLLSTQEVYVERYGVYVTTPEVDLNGGTSTAAIETTVVNDGDEAVAVEVRSSIYEKNGDMNPDVDVLATTVTSAAQTVAAGSDVVVNQTASVDNTKLWDTVTPNLYYVYTEILMDGVVVDDDLDEFGFRTLYFGAENDELTGFYLNGEHTLIMGVADHRAVGALGAAPSDNVLYYRLSMLKDMGVNAIRTAHNPQTPQFFDICNELGIMVMDEIFDGWYGKATNDYGALHWADWWQIDVEEWVLRDRNEPSVIIWSIGNETGTNDKNDIAGYIQNWDTTRGITGGHVQTGANITITGVNGGSESTTYTNPYPDMPFIATEAPHTWQVRGMYETQTWYRDGYTDGSGKLYTENLTEEEIFQYDWAADTTYKGGFQSSYDNAYVRGTARYNWWTTREMDWRMGEFRWTGFDYLGEASYVSGGWPYRLFTSGAIDSAFFEKDLFYLYQSMWKDVDVEGNAMVHILPSWTHPIMELGTEIPVWVYSNCVSVELFQDDVSLGRQFGGDMDERDYEEMQYEWMVPWYEGTLRAVGYDEAGNIIAEEEISSASNPTQISLELVDDGGLVDGQVPVDDSYIAQIEIETQDADGNFYPYGENTAFYYIDGPAYLKAVDNGSPVDTNAHYAVNERDAFMGLNRVYLQPTQDDGDIVFTAASILGEKKQLTSDEVAIDVQQMVLRGDENTYLPEITVYYTTDGTTPTKDSTLYTGTFTVELETTVMAAVYADGQKILDLEETISVTEGLYWDVGEVESVEAELDRSYAYPAEEGILDGTNMSIASSGTGFNGEGYADWGNAAGTLSFDLEDMEAGTYYVGVRYNNGALNTTTKQITISVNGVEALTNTYVNTSLNTSDDAWGNSWMFATRTITLEEGDNLLSLYSAAGGAVNVDEIFVWPADAWYLSNGADIADYGDTSLSRKTNGVGSLGTQYVDYGNNDSAMVYTVTVDKAGRYPISVYYASNNGSSKAIDFYVNRTDDVLTYVAADGTVTIEQTGAWNTIWTVGGVYLYLEEGENTISVREGSGGAVISGLYVGEYSPEPLTGTDVVINHSLQAHTRLGLDEDGNLALVSSDVADDSITWLKADASAGYYYLQNEDTQNILTIEDGELTWVPLEEADASDEWLIDGNREYFDYIIHKDTDMRIAIDSDNGELVVLDADYDTDKYVEDDYNDNYAYWAIYNAVSSGEATAQSVADSISTMPLVSVEDTTLVMPSISSKFSATVAYSSDESIVALDGSIVNPAVDTEITVKLQITRDADLSTATTAELTVTIPAADAEDKYYTVTFDSQGGSAVDSAVTDVRGLLATMYVSTRDGYTFNGWFTEATGGTAITIETVYATDTTVYAQWTELPKETILADASTLYVYPTSEADSTKAYNTNGVSVGANNAQYVDLTANQTVTYTLEDMEAGTYYLAVRYCSGDGNSNSNAGRLMYHVINGVTYSAYYPITSSTQGTWKGDWDYITYAIELVEGTNTIVMKAVSAAVYLDEIAVYPADFWSQAIEMSGTDVTAVTLDDSADAAGAINDQYMLFEEGGVLEYTITVDTAGSYPIYVYHSPDPMVNDVESTIDFHIGDTDGLYPDASLDLTYVAATAHASSPQRAGYQWEIGGVYLYLEAGENTIYIVEENGGSYISAVMVDESMAILDEVETVPTTASVYIEVGSVDLENNTSIFNVMVENSSNMKTLFFTLEDMEDAVVEAQNEFSVMDFGDGTYMLIYAEGNSNLLTSTEPMLAATITVVSDTGAEVTISDVIVATDETSTDAEIPEEKEDTASTEEVFDIAGLKDALIADIEEALADYDEDDYDSDQWTALTDLFADAIADVNDMETKAEVDAYTTDDLLAAADAIATKMDTYDLNGDGVVNYSDITCVSEYYGYDPIAMPEVAKYDVTSDDAINNADYLAIYGNLGLTAN